MSFADEANHFLLTLLPKCSGKTLWWADENITLVPTVKPHIQVVTNRYDIFQLFKQQNWNVSFNDFDTSTHAPESMETILLRLPKEKAVAHYLINQSANLLKAEGTLYLVGEKNEGIRGFVKRAAQRLGGNYTEKKISASLWYAAISCNPQHKGSPLEDQDYEELRQIGVSSNGSFLSKPGVYGWQKVDEGSAFLIAELPNMIKRPLPLAGKVLDLGCGYGYLSISVAGAETQLTCTDNNAAAINACIANLNERSITGKVVPSNAGDTLNEQYDIILCNPPFHSGFTISSELTERFLAAASRCLAPSGEACFVVNRHIGIEQKAVKYFNDIQLHTENKHFKLIHLRQPRPLKEHP